DLALSQRRHVPTPAAADRSGRLAWRNGVGARAGTMRGRTEDYVGDAGGGPIRATAGRTVGRGGAHRGTRSFLSASLEALPTERRLFPGQSAPAGGTSRGLAHRRA